MTNYHIIKIARSYVIPIINGEKTFEIRYNDRGYNRGDRVKFIVVDENGNTINYPAFAELEIEKKEYEITFVLSGFHIDKEYVVFSFREVDND